MYEKELEVGLEAARAGAAIVLEGFGMGVETEFKGDADPVTAVDRASEEHVLTVIRNNFSDDQVLAEESGGAGWDQGRVWLVDPLDGTVNFIHAIPHVAVSVALWVNGRPAVGVIIDVVHREEFTVGNNGGAFSDGNPIRVSSQSSFSHSLIATGFPYDRNLHGLAYAKNMGEVLTRAQGVRRFGSAALDFAWVACGRYEGYWEYGLKPWDTAAGVLLVTEAGGRVTSDLGGEYLPSGPGVVISNGAIHDDLLASIQVAPPRHVI
jgi:myo-inositol-1(or 4)-monophosphatase